MRKHSVGGKNLKRLYYTVYEIRGLNLDRLINTLKKRGIGLYDVKKYGVKRLVLAVNGSDNEKFFAITRELCYNVKKVRDKGRLYPALYLFRNLGLVIGAVVFLVAGVFFDDVIFSFSFTGSGSVYKREVTDYLSGRGIKVYSRFSDLDLKTLEDEILAFNPHLSFASCKKDGNRLAINLVLASDGTDVLSGEAKELRSDVDGVIESIKVYRGTAIAGVGDAVTTGQLLVGGYATVNEQTVEINVLACVTIVTEKVTVYSSGSDGDEERAIVFAEESNPELEPISSEVVKTQENGEFIYTVILKYRHVLYVG